MSWVSDYKYAWYESLAMNVFRVSELIPQHIAFVMDGNRRYAKHEHLAKIDGHKHGFDKLADCLRWCLDLGVKEVTAFAFSIENFKRSEEEVNDLLNLAREKFLKILDEREKLNEHGVCIRVIGNISLLPEELQRLIARAMLDTEQNDKLYLNIAFSYTSQDEITQAVEMVLQHGTELEEEDINERLLEECLYTRGSAPPDLLVRTSGETRISDFLMWQISTTIIYFTNVLWPQITIWNFLGGIFAYQRASLRLKAFKQKEQLRHKELTQSESFCSERVQQFLKNIDNCRRNLLLKLTAN